MNELLMYLPKNSGELWADIDPGNLMKSRPEGLAEAITILRIANGAMSQPIWRANSTRAQSQTRPDARATIAAHVQLGLLVLPCLNERSKKW